MNCDRLDRRMLAGQLAFVAFVFCAFVVLLWATSATVSDEEIRVTPQRAERANP